MDDDSESTGGLAEKAVLTGDRISKLACRIIDGVEGGETEKAAVAMAAVSFLLAGSYTKVLDEDDAEGADEWLTKVFQITQKLIYDYKNLEIQFSYIRKE